MYKILLFRHYKDPLKRRLFYVSSLPKMRKKAFFILFTVSALISFGQQTINQHIEGELDKLYKEEYNRKKEIKISGKRYRIYNNYVTLGAGSGYNSAWKTGLLTTAVDFNFHLQKIHFQAGGFLQGRSYGDNQLGQFHLGVGYRKESYNYFWAAYGGISYTNGYFPVTVKDMNGQDSASKLNHFMQSGLYAAIQVFYKVKFDYGIGLTAFVDANQVQTIIGARIELFFSGAFRGNLRHKDDE
ncbi:MAG TPA: hypothetical protein VNY73_00340 [Bacteroidia bacterium]|jgi:hypothetical protein|nr:hypothetical protein [Bacteroidia bacterium]